MGRARPERRARARRAVVCGPDQLCGATAAADGVDSGRRGQWQPAGLEDRIGAVEGRAEGVQAHPR